ncbi:ABC transporter ATP-binding protein [Chryseotalea sanaruensis]|uniref:ABC transporter ATP-binding protein n=1 Tax=Chryseotalea sanaruensis TaxID=2482724 RepID=A0A401UF89_9BACT|nr:ABC transporter ATP-binding protein [Chryseotalea sanaruensis]GCC53575.1 ABC transporter ATP-binding protein [Chryseotalea sanaruensis]
MSELALSFNKLSVGYRQGNTSKVLFDSIDLTLKAGELVCFMGPNGIGKSTLLKTMAGLTAPLSSSSTNINSKKIAIVLTDRVHAMHMRVRELIGYGRYPYLNWHAQLTTVDEVVIEDALKLLHLKSIADKDINTLSDGQLQMVMIARAIVQDTPIILLDEPTAHLDLNNRVEVMNTLRKLARQSNKAILVSTHELDLALQTADLLWLADDQKLLTGIPEDLVLDGSLDRIFQFKGFDLKTGKVFHESYRGVKINLVGEGHEYLWTKNALERCGYEVGENGELKIEISNFKFQISNGKRCESIQELLEAIDKHAKS